MTEKATKPTKETKSKSVPEKQDMDFAVIESGGKQHLVTVGDVLDVELLAENPQEGEEVVFDKVLMSDDGKDATIGTPYIDGAKVKAKFLAVKKGTKISILRYKAKSNRDRKLGHRQKYARVEIVSLK
ncbi:MAG: 50S ribosomal protein L21 [Candidatus Paceibacterota bacterium]